MKMKLIALTAAAFLGASTLVFTSCQKEKDTDTTETADAALLESNNNDALAILNQANTGTMGQYKTRGCGTITHDTVSIPHTLTVFFGASNCLCGDGKYRRGSIVCTYTGKYKDAGSVHTITTDSLFVNDNQIIAHKTVTNNGLNAAGHSTYSVVVADTIIKANAGGIVSWNSTRTREFTAGESTPMWGDDVYSVTGSGSGVRANGYSYTMNITQPLIIDNSCQYRLVSGIMQIQPQGKALRTINFGTGTCDDNATVTINSKVYNIHIK